MNSCSLSPSYLNNLDNEQQVKQILNAKIELLAEQVKHFEHLELLNQHSSSDNKNLYYNQYSHIFNNQVPIQQVAMHQVPIHQDIVLKQLNEQEAAIQTQLFAMQTQINEQQVPIQTQLSAMQTQLFAMQTQINEQQVPIQTQLSAMQTQLNEQQESINQLIKQLHNLANFKQEINEKKEEINEIKEEIDVKLLIDIFKNDESKAFSAFEKSNTQIKQYNKDIRKCYFNISFETSKQNIVSCIDNIKDGFNKPYNEDDDYVLLETSNKNLYVIAVNNNEELHNVFVSDWWTTKNIQDISEKIRTIIINAFVPLIPKLKIIYPQGQKIVVCYIENQGLRDNYNFIRLFVSNIDNGDPKVDYVLK
jgi:hypothetical protein